ncbi:MAG: hypothetical protein JXL97_20060 [Bacteroidales bacterium]|nr:hypothetical protein [Bacteroidales bacterium]
MKLFLDDQRVPSNVAIRMDHGTFLKEPWKIVKNYNEFVDYVSNNEMPEIISFDHDLTAEHYKYAFAESIPYGSLNDKTGYHCLLWLILFCEKAKVKLPEIFIHTQNIEGAENMKNLIDVYKQIK